MALLLASKAERQSAGSSSLEELLLLDVLVVVEELLALYDELLAVVVDVLPHDMVDVLFKGLLFDDPLPHDTVDVLPHGFSLTGFSLFLVHGLSLDNALFLSRL